MVGLFDVTCKMFAMCFDQCCVLSLELLSAAAVSLSTTSNPLNPHLIPVHGSPCALYLRLACLQAQKEATLAREAELETAQAAGQQLRQQLSSSSSSSAALREAQAESEALRQQLEESARKYNTVKQARERAMTEVIALKPS